MQSRSPEKKIRYITDQMIVMVCALLCVLSNEILMIKMLLIAKIFS